MGNIPLSSALGVSMSVFGTLISIIAIKSCNAKLAKNGDYTGEVVTIAIAVCLAAIGMLVHGVNLDFDPAMRSFTFAFIGANLTVGFRLWTGREDAWLDFMPVLVVVIVSGLIIGLLISQGDVQKETRERWRREAESKLAGGPKGDGKQSEQ